MHRIYFAVLVACVVWATHPPAVAAAPKRKTTCVHTGNAYFFKMCDKKSKKCWLEYGIQYFMHNWDPKTRRFTFRCTLRYGRGLRKQKVGVEHITLKPTVNCLGGVVFTWPKIRVDRAKRRYKYKCTCTVSSLLLAKTRK